MFNVMLGWGGGIAKQATKKQRSQSSNRPFKSAPWEGGEPNIEIPPNDNHRGRGVKDVKKRATGSSFFFFCNRRQQGLGKGTFTQGG